MANLYIGYIDCLNRQDWARLGDYVDVDVERNGHQLGLRGLRDLLVGNFADILDLRFDIELLICEPPRVAARLGFVCSPREKLFGLNVDGRTVSFAENVFYEFRNSKIALIWSVIDKLAIEAQLAL